MHVTVVDRAAMDAAWGTSAFAGAILATVEISDDCPKCGKPRGKPEKRRFHEFGEYYYVDCWHNACGHLDRYRAVLREAQRRGADARS